MFRKTIVEDDSHDTEVLEENSRNIIVGIISQLRKDMDLSRVALPTFILEPRSMLEKITDFMAHPDILLEASKTIDPVDRFVEIVRYFMSGWHGVKKPYNPVLGEFFRCQWQFRDQTKAYYVAEQISHHPPISAYYFGSPDNGIHIEGEIHPKARFLGNSAASIMQGYSRIHFTRFSEEYHITSPNVYARGILCKYHVLMFGKMTMELGDRAIIRCEANDLVCEIDFKAKGVFSGQANLISGKIKRESTSQVLYELSGAWNSHIFIHKAKKPSSPISFFHVQTASKPVPKRVDPEEQQDLNESRRLWAKVTAAIKANDMDLARDEKQWIEDSQRVETTKRQKQSLVWQPRFFVATGTDYRFKGSMAIQPRQTQQDLESWIFGPLSSTSRSTQEILQERRPVQAELTVVAV
ncbi:hypothetical protein PHYBLDRAFT_144291 [Phycomyces blakesleeanus NRRL 1555(-)]|uniref:Oxysterol-binding protein n=1 Tax=Phycomyces blakesleeanus (strain ATCC 8743b / DSM 1359 / FGSC 10004 / NBRC 33097 / NRRL 1555) TaxID=763407 RepID=A0A167N491_PHYB8|nr:hypothetical protein PHYBLDRAFT_144291 [Phycomyces blakesleeanus NRRL 1555(-)]OAD74939.1 hypothetical protein PHYBLDRAFT_144291 [Phycomyces blakesleeanus NRRL 1555(-)]|eukprot:XP_018292979.1 hypothetical protein PHYBLDRAFT_144291 [Phycomyces blakesleeanus NRRL 1555(-)]